LPDFAPGTAGPFGTGLFIRQVGDHLRGQLGQWGLIRPGQTARVDYIQPKALAGKKAPATWYAEPNWETGKNIWWHLKRADGQPWFLAGLWSEWTDQASGEVVPNFTMITCNCDNHPLLGRLHKPDPKLAPDQQDKRSLAHIDPGNWDQWLHGTEAEARELIQPQPLTVFDMSDASRTDALLADPAESGSLF
jgi:hypothetical protein